MADLLVKSVDEELVRALKRQADEHGVSAEEEHRRILREALRPETAGRVPSFWQALTDMPDVGGDLLFKRNRCQLERPMPRGFPVE